MLELRLMLKRDGLGSRCAASCYGLRRRKPCLAVAPDTNTVAEFVPDAVTTATPLIDQDKGLSGVDVCSKMNPAVPVVVQDRVNVLPDKRAVTVGPTTSAKV